MHSIFDVRISVRAAVTAAVRQLQPRARFLRRAAAAAAVARPRLVPGVTLIALALGACSADGPAAPVTEREEVAAPTGSVTQTIAFASTRHGRWTWPDIYLAHSDGSGVTRLTHGRSPAWSPDGKRIAFERSASSVDRAGVYVIGADGSGERFVSPGTSPGWTPDGRIVLVSGGIAVVNADGSGFRRIVPLQWASAVDGGACEDPWLAPAPRSPVWSPAGGHIAFVQACAGEWSQLYIARGDGSERTRLDDSFQAHGPAWSRDGTRLAAAIDGAITILDLATGERSVHLRGVVGGRIAWLDDDHVVFERDYDQRRLYRLSLANDVVQQLVPGITPDYYSDFDVAVRR